MFENITKRLKWTFARIRMSNFFWRIQNREGIKLYRFDKPTLRAVDKKIVSDLESDGISIANITDLLPENLIKVLYNFVDTRVSSPEIQEQIIRGSSNEPNKPYNISLIESGNIDLENPLVKALLDDVILNIASSYMGMFPKFRGYRLWATLPVVAGAGEEFSQRWHRDPEDKKMVKVFIYFRDVDNQSGPFTYARQSHVSGGKWSHLYPQLFPAGSYPKDGVIEKTLPKESIIKVTGAKGSIVFCDTSGFHKGGYCDKKIRLMSIGVYASSASREPINYTYARDLDLKKLPKRQRYALENWERFRTYKPSGM